MSNVRIDYGGVATGAKDDFVPDVSNKTDFTDLSQLTQDGLTFPNYGNPCEVYTVPLDGSVEPIPTETEGLNFGWWTQKISTETGEFDTPIALTLTADNLYTSSGITFTFDTINNIYSNYLYIKWYRDDELISDMEFFPDSAFYFCENKVELFNKIEVIFYSINTSFNRMRLHAIDYGMRISFFGDELRNVKITQEINPLSTSIPISTCNFTLDSKRNIDYAFQEYQPLSVYFNDSLIMKCFIKTAKRKGRNLWDIQAEDYVAILEKNQCAGNMYYYVANNRSAKATSVLKSIFESAHMTENEYEIDPYFDDVDVVGYIPYTSCREALKQVCFASGGVVDTSNSDKVRVIRLSDDVTQTISLERIRQGQNFNFDKKATVVELTYHSYNTSTTEITTLYETGSGEDEAETGLVYKPSEPMADYTVRKATGDAAGGTIIFEHVNYVIFDIQENSVLKARKYIHSSLVKSKTNPDVLQTDPDNIISITNATLVNKRNVDETLERCYNYYKEPSYVNLKIIEGKKEVEIGYAKYGEAKYGEALYGVETKSRAVVSDPTTKVGDVVISQTECLGDVKGRILKQTYTLNGNILVKDSRLKRS